MTSNEPEVEPEGKSATIDPETGVPTVVVGRDDDGHELQVTAGGPAYEDYVFIREVEEDGTRNQSVLVHDHEIDALRDALKEVQEADE